MRKVLTQRSISILSFIWLLSLYFAFVINFPLILKLKSIIPVLDVHKTLFIISIPVALACSLSWIISVLTIRYIEKIILIILLIMSAIMSYTTYNYGVIFDFGMIENIMQTNVNESTSYVNWSLALWLLIFGLIPSYLIYKTNISRPTFFKEVLLKTASGLISLLIITIIAFTYYKDYAFTLRNNHYLEKMITPVHGIYSAGHYYVRKVYRKKIKYQQIGLDARHTSSVKQTNDNLLVLVIGETARSQNFQLNAYPRPTNFFTQGQSVISFQKVKSCGTATAVSLPCMFSNLGRRKFSVLKADNQDNLLDIVQRAGDNVAWIDNDDGCKGVCKHIKTFTIDRQNNKDCDAQGNCYDESLFEQFDNYIKTADKKDTIVILHLIGSHGPNYFNRYPANHRYFTPDCVRTDIQNCTRHSLINAYDNTIRYTDYIVNQLIERLKNVDKQWNTSLVYISDHGESFGESGLYLHGTPYSFAPKEQTSIPLITWFSPEFIANKSLDYKCLTKKALGTPLSHDNFFHSILGLMDIQTQVYKENLDLFHSCRVVI